MNKGLFVSVLLIALVMLVVASNASGKLEQGVAHKLSPVSTNDNIASNLTVAADCEAEYAEVLALEEALAEAQAAYDECMGDTPSPVPDPEEATRRLAGMSSILER